MLESRTRGLQLSLAEQGLPANGRIGVLTGDHPLCYSSICAILASGCAFVPLSHRSPEDRLLSVIEDAGLELVISHRLYEPLDAAVTSTSQCSLVRSDEIDAVSGAIDLPESDPDGLVYLLYTSGSTGKPKGVPIYHRNLEAFLGVMLDQERYAFSPDDRFLQMFDLTFDASVPAYFIPFCTGASTFVIPEDGVVSLNRGGVAVLRATGTTAQPLWPYRSDRRLLSIRTERVAFAQRRRERDRLDRPAISRYASIRR